MTEPGRGILDYLERARVDLHDHWTDARWSAMAAACGEVARAIAAAGGASREILLAAAELGEAEALAALPGGAADVQVQVALAQALAVRGDLPGALDALDRADRLGGDGEARAARHFAARELIERALRRGDRAAADAVLARRPDDAPSGLDSLWVEGLVARGDVAAALAYALALGGLAAVSALATVASRGEPAAVLALIERLPGGEARDDLRDRAVHALAATDPGAAMRMLPAGPWTYVHDAVLAALCARGDGHDAAALVERAGAAAPAYAVVLVAVATGEAKRAVALAKALPVDERWGVLLAAIRALPPEAALVEARAIRHNDYRGWALGDVAAAHAAAGNLEGADAVCAMINRDQFRREAVLRVVEERLVAGDPDGALWLARRHADQAASGLVLVALAHGLAGRHAAAEAVVADDPDARRRVDGWLWLAYAQAWQHGRAIGWPWRELFDAHRGDARDRAPARFARLFPAVRNPF